MARNIFVSYSHADNERQGGRVLQVVRALVDEYSVLEGEEIDTFIDHEAIAWGDRWREQIDSALTDSPFLIAMISPNFIRSAECRREVLSFVSQTGQNASKLLLPILFVDVEDLSVDSEDELRALIARTQYFDWRDLRLKSAESPEYMNAINILAERLRKAKRDVAASQLKEEIKDEAELADDLTEVLSRINDQLGPWLGAVDFASLSLAQWRAISDERLGRVARLRAQRSSAGAILSVYRSFGLSVLPIAKERLSQVRTYSRLTITLNPDVVQAVSFIDKNPEFADALQVLRSGVEQAVENIRGGEYAPDGVGPGKDVAKYSKHLDETMKLMEEGDTMLEEANRIVKNWADRLGITDPDEPLIPGRV
ncbi:toll/interleukin-1 receptor domain-containing protein [Curtobacterium sp. MCPF17_002]|uniref:toll/interleukin-1 receptor domain-containing protein n=1 Tax=Curtobacterium sp. MCPF17_002 TaxID=2175645 RepID=UPI000DA6ED97|nr:toll/interleukin-1 receptor domain-containing protein [Curtobacterium sp. MCPF17_002]WIB78011.1 toll/interleukin-1 receptor domain-containing protein [Curtobacterium sp. MCPF17_002]